MYATLSATETGNAVRVHCMAGWSCVPTDLEHYYPVPLYVRFSLAANCWLLHWAACKYLVYSEGAIHTANN